MEASRDFEDLWADWPQEQAADLLADARGAFDTSSAAISYYLENLEVFHAESGYDAPHVRRIESIAGHVLLSGELLFVPDATKVSLISSLSQQAANFT